MRFLFSIIAFISLSEGDGATAAAGAKAAPPKDPLPKVPCLEALAELRHAKWFQVRCSNLQSAAITLRILRDVRQRVQTWQPLKAWTTELLVEKVLSSLGAPLSPGDALRRVFEAIASGILFSMLAIDRLPDIRNNYASGNSAASGSGSGNTSNDRKRPRDCNASLDDGEVVG
ncbi:hypothetical protein X798_07096 [Onchocerca flexuosa]|uniref:DZF domain-containing protein n=1 Tax=Onchocerca flexuosa TaxID=387005 RepID=A0A238BKG4_9BILA|nr:hypothetical protein X798_07096 [Onchocerca flexuosa]